MSMFMMVNYPLVEGKDFDYDRYVTHMRLATAASDGAIKKVYINKLIPGAGYNALPEPWPQQCCIGILEFDSYDDFVNKFKPAVVPLRDDIKHVSELRAYTNFFEFVEVPRDPLNEEEQALLDGYMANVEK